MRCSHCPVDLGPCLGERAARLCELAATRDDYRRLLVERARALLATTEDPRTSLASDLAKVVACPRRGPVLPHSLQPECGCAELTECRGGRGVHPGRVTLRDCLACVSTTASVAERAAAPLLD